MAEPLLGRDLLAIRARTMRAQDKPSQTRAEKDRYLLLVELYRIREGGDPLAETPFTRCECGYVGRGPCPCCTPDPSDHEAVA